MANSKLLAALIAAATATNVLAKDADITANKFEHPIVPKNNFTISEGSFFEDFQGYNDEASFRKKWVSSKKRVTDPYSNQEVEQYPVKWGIDEAYAVPGFIGDKALITYNDQGFAMIGSTFKKPLVMEDGDNLVIQYEVKVQTSLECGGAFIKLLPPIKKSQLKKYGDEDSPTLELIFGPDNCVPYTNEVHLGFRRHNPISNKTELKFLDKAPESRLGEDLRSHLYTLFINGKTQDFEIRYDGEVIYAANLLDEGVFDPPFGGIKMIPDPDAVKPESWDDRETIADPAQLKPESWDDRRTIPDPEATKPKEWDESIPEFIADSTRKNQPEWWDEEKDGEWVAPMIVNPSCETKGCGKWEAEMIANPDYKGPWNQPMIKNPDYMGIWEPELIKNPEYFDDLTPSKLAKPIGGVLFEFYSGSVDLMFNNIYVGKSIEEAETIGNHTFKAKRELEEKELALRGDSADLLDSNEIVDKRDVDEEEKLFNFSPRVQKVVDFVMLLPPLVQGLGIGFVFIVVFILSAGFIIYSVQILKTEDEKRKLAAKELKTQKAKKAQEAKESEEVNPTKQPTPSAEAAENATGVSKTPEELAEELELRLRKKMIGSALEFAPEPEAQ